jgi:hypothetical protein
MSAPRPSLAWKIATANILLALFAMLLAGMLQYRKQWRILTTTMRQELTQVVTSGALLIDGEKMDKLAETFRREGSGAGQVVESVFEEMGRLCSVPPGDDSTVLAITWTPERAGVSSS